MNAYWKRPLQFPWPPAIFALAFVAAILIDGIIPAPPLAFRPMTTGLLGGGLVVLALALDLWSLVSLVAAKTTVLPNRGSNHLVTTGPFRFSRNPIYLGYTLMCLGLGIILDNGWIMVGGVVAAIITHLVAIRAEQNHLLARFGIEYERYCRKTRAWI